MRVCVLGLLAVSACCACLRASPAAVYPVNDIAGLGRIFDGIGGLSAGASSKLLANYPAQQRNEILDLLFKPNFGASMHILKVEIGGDVQSTDGTEASHMHNSWEENYNRGYEWWLMKEAKKRNPGIILYALPWGFPGWLGDGTTDNPYKNPAQLAEYVVKWIVGAKQVHNLTIDFIGIWNERPYDATYIKTLRRTLDDKGCAATRIVASDNKWEIAQPVLSDPDLAQAVDVIGCHYPGTYSGPVPMETGKPLWSSEDYSTFDDQVGGGCWARILNQNYVNGNMTSTISWALIASYYNHLPYYGTGLMTAVEPWSGYYEVQTPIWVSAHTTQFTEVGWRYLGHGSGVGHLESGGSYVSLVSPDLHHLTIVIETMSHDSSVCIRPRLPPYSVMPQTAIFSLGGSFGQIKELNVWVSKFNLKTGMPTMFQRASPIQVINGKVTVTLGVDEVFTLTTMTTGGRGQYAPPPPSQPFPLPYKDDFQGYAESQEPFNLAPQSGSFEVVEVAPNVKVMRQTVLQHPVSWCQGEDANASLALVGDFNWTDVEVRVDFGLSMANSSSGVFLGARVQGGGCSSVASGLFLYLFPQTQVFFLSQDYERTMIFAGGRLPFSSNNWNNASLTVKGGRVEASYNGDVLLSAAVPPELPSHGFVGLGTAAWGLADFDNLHILPVTQADHARHPLLFKPN